VDEPSRIYGFPRTSFVADFIGQCNLFSGPIVTHDDGIAIVEVPRLGRVRAATPGPLPPGSEGTIALRPEKIRLGATAPAAGHDNHFRGTVHDLLYMGDVTVYRVNTPGGAQVEALLANSASGRAKFFEVGDAVEMSGGVDAGHFLDRQDER
jgi:spermidine/putrescine transport system ATP-binding protein